MSFLKAELKVVKEQFVTQWGGEKVEVKEEENAIDLICSITEERAKSYTLTLCFEILKETTVNPGDVALDLAVGNNFEDWKGVLQQLVGFILSIELENLIDF